MWWLLSAVVAVTASLVEIASAIGLRMPRAAWGWASLRIAIDGFVGAVVYAPATSILPSAWTPPLVAFVAGLSGAAILRATINVDRGNRSKASLGLEKGYSRLFEQIDAQIKAAGKLDTTSWLAANKAALDTLNYQKFAFIANAYFLQDPDGESKASLDLIKRLSRDEVKSDLQKREELLNHLVATRQIALLKLATADGVREPLGDVDRR